MSIEISEQNGDVEHTCVYLMLLCISEDSSPALWSVFAVSVAHVSSVDQ